MPMEEEEDAVEAKSGDEYMAVFLGHNLTPPLVEATIMVRSLKNHSHGVSDSLM